MIKPVEKGQGQIFGEELKELLNPKHPLYLLSERMPWEIFEKEFENLYSKTGRPAKPVRLMTSLLILKQMYDLSDESVIEAWIENPYYQYFSGMKTFQWRFSVDSTDLVYFRKRIGEKGVEKILEVSISLHGKKALEKEVVVDTTVQEKNITFPTDTKLYRDVIEGCVEIADKESIVLRQSYRRTVKKLMLDQRFRNHPRNYKKAIKSQKKLRVIAGRLLRELERKLSDSQVYRTDLDLYKKVIEQERNDPDKIYSVHEPHVYCIAKGKEHKKYEFGAKASIVLTKDSNIIVGAMSFSRNIYDGHTLQPVLSQVEYLTGKRPAVAIADKGYRGISHIESTEILTPSRSKKSDSEYDKRKAKKRFRRRSAIEAVISHLKYDYRLARNYLKGIAGDSINLILAAAAFNFSKLMRELVLFCLYFLTITAANKNHAQLNVCA